MHPGMNAIIGPTGCGKSSLLDALAGRKNPKLLSGQVYLDGRIQTAQDRRHACGYVVQDNIAVDMLTVRENIAFSAALRLSDHQLSVCDRKTRVDNVIDELGLSAVADRILGTEFVRGVSGGERKRTCIGIELVKDPLVLYLDEPTTGLDAYTAFSVMETLKRLADAGRTIVFSIHQSKYSIYRLFDRLTFLADGQLVYHGAAGKHPLDYFAQFGYLIEGFDNPADFLMDILHGEVPVTVTEGTTSEQVMRLRAARGNPSDSDEAVDSRTPLRSNTLSLRNVVTDCLIELWRQSDMWQECLTLLEGIARRYRSSSDEAKLSSRGSLRLRAAALASRLQQTPPAQANHRAGSDNTAPLQRLLSSGSYQVSTSGPTVRAYASERAASLPTRTDSLPNFTSPAPWSIYPASQGLQSDSLLASCPQVSGPAAIHDATPADLAGQKSVSLEPGQLRGSDGRRRSTCLPGRRVYAVSYCRQLWTLNWRQFLSMLRDYKSLLIHFTIQLLIAVFLGTIYFNLDCSIESGIQNRAGLFFFTCLQLMFINTSMLETFLKDRVIFLHETSSGFYSVSAYFLAKLISEVLPTKALPALIFLPITYLMAGLRRTWLAFGFWQLTIALLSVTSSTIAFSVSAMVTNFRIGATLLSMCFVLMMITSGYLINVLSLGIWLRWLRYLSIIRLSMNTLLINELVGVMFCPTGDAQSHPAHASHTSIDNVLNTESFAQLNGSSRTFDGCIAGETFLATQSIEFRSHWAIWQNPLGVFIVLLLALLNTYVYLRCIKKYK